MISVPCGTGDIADAMISASQMIYAFGIWRNGYYIMLAKQVYHTATPYIISQQRYIIEKRNIM